MTMVDMQGIRLKGVSKLLGHHDIRYAYQDFLVYFREYVPADYLSLHLFDEGLGMFETVVDATPEHSSAINRKTVISPEARELVRRSVEGVSADRAFRIIDCLRDEPMAQQLGMDLKTPDSASLVVSLIWGRKYLGAVALTPTSTEVRYTKEHGRLMAMFHDALALQAVNYLNFRECERLRHVLSDRTDFLHSEIMRSVDAQVVGADFGLKDVVQACRQVAPTRAPVLLLGETGSGKEVVASAIHRLSAYRDGPFIRVNCGGIPSSLLESSLFGHVKGAFTGATSDKKGYFERAEGGTIFLDEIGELTPEAQTRFLHILQDSVFERVGGGQVQSVDVRVIAATHRNLEEMAETGLFRRDLLFRLNVFPVMIPPLRQRKVDIPPLADHFIRKIAANMGLPEVPKVAPGAVDRLVDYDWPGNVRELANVIEREIIIRPGGPLSFDNICYGEGCSRASDLVDMNLDKAVSRHIVRALRMTGGKIEGEGGAADLLGVNPRTLQSRMKKLGIPFGRKAGNIYRS